MFHIMPVHEQHSSGFLSTFHQIVYHEQYSNIGLNLSTLGNQISFVEQNIMLQGYMHVFCNYYMNIICIWQGFITFLVFKLNFQKKYKSSQNKNLAPY